MMAKKNIRNVARRGLALFLSLVMMTSLLQLTAFAAPYEKQLMDGYFVVDETGVTGTTDSVSHTAHGFTLSKSIDQTGENAFNVTLEVVTSQTVTTNDAAIQIVVDLSNSMKYCAKCGAEDSCRCNAGTRLEAVKKALANANGFLDSLVANNKGTIYVSVIWFGSGAGVACDWTDISTASGLSSVKSAVNNLKIGTGGDSGGTNLEGGLMLARNRLSMKAISSVAKNNKYTVLLSDGAPTRRMTKDVTSTSSISSSDTSNDNSGTQTSANERNEAAAMATQVKNLSTLYSVCYGVSETFLYGTDKCANCGETRNNHNAVNEGWGLWSDWHYYCKNNSRKEYTGGSVSIGDYLENEVATKSNGEITYAFDAGDSDEVNAAFADIAQSASAGMNGGGTTVTDPMGQFIKLGSISAEAAGKGLTASGSTLTWALDPDKAFTKTEGNTTTYTYSVTYPITLDTSAEGFRETEDDGSVKYYPTNGYTYLSVEVEGKVEKIPFNVPGVCGKIPEVKWAVEYYLQDDAESGDYDNYKLDDDAEFGPVDVWTTVSAPEGYAEKYSKDNYKFVSGSIELLVTPTGENVMRLYYDYITSAVTVNHWYKTNRWTAEGEFVEGTYSEDDKVTVSEQARVNTEYTAEEQTTYNQAVYELQTGESFKTITVALDESENVIDLYYLREVDERAITSARVDHIYVTYGYELKNGVYEKVEIGRVTEPAEQAAEIRATTVFNVSDKPLAEYKDFELNKDLGDYEDLVLPNGTLGFTVVADASENVRELVFEKTVDERTGVKVTVNHYYTKSVTTVENGKVTTTVDPDKEKGKTERFDAYVGESFTAEEYEVYKNDTYIPDAGNAEKLHIDALEGNVTIDLYYSLIEEPEQTSIIVNHYWRTFTEVTVEEVETTVDPETGESSTVVVGTKTIVEEDLAHSIEDIEVNDLYVGEEYTAPKEVWGEGYTYNEKKSNPTGIAGEDRVLNLYYDLWADEDRRADAEIDVKHNYVTELTTIVNGEVGKRTINDGSVEESFPAEDEELKAGDSFTAIPVPTYNENDYEKTTEDEALSVILQPGTNATIVIDYIREDNDLVDTAYTANYEYRTYTMTVNEDGVAGYWDEPVVEAGESISGTGYVGQKITLSSGDREGFTPSASNPATTQILAAEGNEWTFVHEQYNSLGQAQVVVNHHYETITIAIDGTSSSSTSDVEGAPVIKYVGETYVAESAPNGFELIGSKVDGVDAEAVEGKITVTATGETVVDFYYKKTIDNSVSTSYSITHIYNYYTYDGDLISSNSPAPTTGTGYVGNLITAEAEPNSYELVKVTYNEEKMTSSPYTITLQEGSNDIVLTYEKYEPRANVNVTVIHNYYQDEAALAAETKTASFQETVSEVPEDSEYTAENFRNEDQGLVYKFHSADPENRTITVTKNGENIIILNYLRQEAGYKVIHRYYTNNELEGSSGDNDILNGFAGDVIKGEDIARITSYEGNEYQFTDITEDIVLEANTIKTITLSYNRTVYVPVPEPGISISKSAANEVVKGAEFEYTLKVRSTGDAAAENVVVTDVLPAEVELVEESDAPYTYDAENRTITWNVGTLASGASAELKFMVTALTTGNVKNVAEVTASGGLEDKDDVTTVVVNPDPKPDPRPEPIDPPKPDPVDPPTPPVIEIPEEPTPLAPAPAEEPIEILDEEVPLANVPKTGDISALWYAMSAISGLGLIGLAVTGKKKEDEEV